MMAPWGTKCIKLHPAIGQWQGVATSSLGHPSVSQTLRLQQSWGAPPGSPPQEDNRICFPEAVTPIILLSLKVSYLITVHQEGLFLFSRKHLSLSEIR